MTFADLEKTVRREIADETGGDPDRHVQRFQMLAYANEAVAEACIRGRLLVDSSTAEICTIPLVAGTSVYPVDSRVLSILRGKPTGGMPLNRMSFLLMDEHMPGWDEKTGTPTMFITGMDKQAVRLYSIPAADGTLNLTVIRLPLQEMQGNSDSPEIPARLHQSLVLWMKHRVYNNQDSELFDRNRADIHLELFERKFGTRPADQDDLFEAMQYTQMRPDNGLVTDDYL